MKELYEKLATSFNLQDFEVQRPDLAFATATPAQIVSLLTHLRDIQGFTHLVMVTCVDWIETDQFQVLYILQNYTHKHDLGIRVFLSRQNPVLDSIHHLWKQSRVYQRELHEMYGIDFPGSPEVEIPMILEGWQGPPPMRRDFDTKLYCEENYSNRERDHHEPEEYMKQKLYPED